MTDPERLLASGATDFERLVLGAARTEHPNVSQRRRMHRALFLAEFSFLTAGFKAIASVVNSNLVLVAVIAGVFTGSSSHTPTLRRSVSVTAPAEFGPSNVGLEPVTTKDTTVAIRADASALDTPKDREVKSQTRTVAPTKTVDLREEIRLLDEARMAIRSNNPNRAISTVNRYLAQFPRGAFRQEASVLRIEALAMSGKHTQAASEAKRFVAKHPGSPHVDKLQRVTESAVSPAKP